MRRQKKRKKLRMININMKKVKAENLWANKELMITQIMKKSQLAIAIIIIAIEGKMIILIYQVKIMLKKFILEEEGIYHKRLKI